LWALARATGSNNADALRIAVTLGQGGEFGFVLFGAAVSGQLISADIGMMLVAIVAISMAITPLVISTYDRLALRLAKEGVPSELVEGFGQVHAKVLILGYGRFGAIVGDMMMRENIDVIAIDRNTSRIQAARASGHKVYFGDITRIDVLKSAGAADAALVAICAENIEVLEKSLILVRDAFPDKAIFCRARDGKHAAELHQKGADFQVQETFESGIVFGRAALEQMGVTLESIDHVEDEIRRSDQDQFNDHVDGG
jgi:CPA2 family monovalent cation:H+ antiporter-2/glutathione-regulated potassium-efflux system protein KefB